MLNSDLITTPNATIVPTQLNFLFVLVTSSVAQRKQQMLSKEATNVEENPTPQPVVQVQRPIPPGKFSF